jgi:hypothetical protein
MNKLRDLTVEQLKAEALKYVLAKGRTEGTWETAVAVAKELGADVYSDESLGVKPGWRWEGADRQKAFQARVGRVLRLLTQEGALRKAGKGECAPDGARRFSAAVLWYSPAKWDTEVAAAAVRKQLDEAAEQTWQDVRDRLWVKAEVVMDDRHRVSLGMWLTLLEKAGW